MKRIFCWIILFVIIAGFIIAIFGMPESKLASFFVGMGAMFAAITITRWIKGE